MGVTRNCAECAAAIGSNAKPVQLFAKTEILCYTFPLRQIKPAPLAGRWRETGLKETPFEVFGAESEGGKDFFIWIRCNPLKSPDSAKEIQRNPSFFPWFYLVFLGFVWPQKPNGRRTAMAWRRPKDRRLRRERSAPWPF
jgi:hypothetical protein